MADRFDMIRRYYERPAHVVAQPPPLPAGEVGMFFAHVAGGWRVWQDGEWRRMTHGPR